MANDAKLAQAIIAMVGGTNNIKHVIHCVTRLRFYLKDPSQAQQTELEALEGVAGDVYNEGLNQLQVVIGQGVADLHVEVVKQLGQSSDEQAEAMENDEPKQALTIKRAFQMLVGTITGSMIPIIGLLAAGGMINGLLTLLSEPSLLHWIDASSDTYVVLSSMAMAPFYFLPVLVGISAAKQLKSDPYVVGTIGGFMIHPNILNLITPHIAGDKIVNLQALGSLWGLPLNVNYFGLPIHVPNYAYTIFPIIFAAWLARPVGN